MSCVLYLVSYGLVTLCFHFCFSTGLSTRSLHSARCDLQLDIFGVAATSATHENSEKSREERRGEERRGERRGVMVIDHDRRIREETRRRQEGRREAG